MKQYKVTPKNPETTEEFAIVMADSPGEAILKCYKDFIYTVAMLEKGLKVSLSDFNAELLPSGYYYYVY